MTDERLTALEKRIEQLLTSGGASVTVQDPRVNSMVRWVGGITAALVIALLVWVGTTVMEVKTSVAVLRVQADTSAPALAQVNAKADLLQTQMSGLQVKVGIIESRQAEARNVNR